MSRRDEARTDRLILKIIQWQDAHGVIPGFSVLHPYQSVKATGQSFVLPPCHHVEKRAASKIDKASMTISDHWITRREIDRVGDLVEPKGLDLEGYRQNPIVLANHVPHVPVGVSLIQTASDSGVMATTQFHDKTREASEWGAMYMDGILKGWSIGFQPRAAYELDEKILHEMGYDPESGIRPGVHFRRAELVEYSAVPIPAVRGALTSAIETGKIKSPVLKHLLAETDEKAPAWSRGMTFSPAWHEKRINIPVLESGSVWGPECPKTGAIVLRAITCECDLETGSCTCSSSEKSADEAALSSDPIEQPAPSPAGEDKADAQSDCVKEKIRKLIAEGKDQDQAVAIAYSMCGEGKRLEMPLIAKMFDVATERLEPSNVEIEWAARFIGCGVKDLHVLNTSASGPMRGGFMDAFAMQTSSVKVADTRNLDDEGTERPPVYETVQIKSDSRKTFLTEGVRFMAHPDGWKFVYRTYESWTGRQDVCIYSEDAERAQDLVDRTWTWLHEHNPLRGEAFALTGGFLSRTGASWDDVFLDDSVEAALKRTARIVNEKGKGAANRGIVMAGPPGTGKTLSARVMMNECDATYIWVSAKDFYNAGSYYCFSGAFGLARELAPSVVLFEDIDNYVDDYTVDLLKTEMDGLAQSSGVTTILTTNFPDRLPAALIDRPGRFHDVLEIDLPSKAVREKMLSKWTDASTESIAEMAAKTEGLSGAHIFELASFARVIRDEDDQTIEDALVKALAKVEAQRELISDGQLSGSSYRRFRAAGQPAHREYSDETLLASDTMIVKAHTERLGDYSVTDLTVQKAGRVISASNMAKLQSACEHMDECARQIREVISAGSPEEDDSATGPVDGMMDPKTPLVTAAPVPETKDFFAEVIRAQTIENESRDVKVLTEALGNMQTMLRSVSNKLENFEEKFAYATGSIE